MATPADLVRDNCDQLAAYHPRLERLITELSSPAGGVAPRPSNAPFPGNAPAFAALMVIIEAVPRLEATLRLAVAGHPGQRRGGSTGNFMQALDAIPALAAGLPSEDDEAAAARVLEWLLNVARVVPDIDEAERWRLVRGRACPYCGCYTVKVLLDDAGRPTRHVECFSGPRVNGERCADGNGQRPVATIGGAGLEWADGLVEAAPDLDG